MWQNGLQSALGIAKCGRAHYKVRQGLQSVTELQSESIQLVFNVMQIPGKKSISNQ